MYPCVPSYCHLLEPYAYIRKDEANGAVCMQCNTYMALVGFFLPRTSELTLSIYLFLLRSWTLFIHPPSGRSHVLPRGGEEALRSKRTGIPEYVPSPSSIRTTGRGARSNILSPTESIISLSSDETANKGDSLQRGGPVYRALRYSRFFLPLV